MKTLIWKLCYAYRLRKVLAISWFHAWDNAGAQLESDPSSVDESPRDMADEEVEAWRQSI